ncbi:WD repeat-containing and planar cell polarity effector protein fritz homolog [Planococcus citri]|uniref:WD repeat-containing and planar cell polarity effector protein fritz homolog n=1 Tax=Planococcus citri TaxID=170843 RepID=UPI0031F80DDE
MLSLLFEIHFWTLNDEIYVSNNDFGAFRYHDKKETTKSLSYEKKKSFAQSRNYQWTVSNKRPYKLKQHLRELEDHVESQRIVRIKWLREDTVVLFFNSGVVAYVSIDVCSGDIVNLSFDKFSKDKLLSVHISDIFMTNVFSICCYNDPQMTLIYYSKPQFKKLFKKLNELEPKFTSVNLPGPNGRRLPRKLCSNKTGDVIAVWWKYSENDVFPWSPLVKDVDRANVHVYSVSGCKMEVLCYHRTEFDLLCVAFSSVESNILFIVEQRISREGNISVESSTYEIIKCSRLQRVGIVSISLQSNACCVEFSPDRSNLLLGCVDGSVVLYNQTRALTHIVRTAFVPSIVRWHADGYLAAVASDRGRLQCFDFALSCVKMQSISEDVTPSNVIDLSVYFTQMVQSQNTPMLVQMEWNAKGKDGDACTDDSFLLMTFSGGPLVMLRVLGASTVTPVVLMTQYLNANQVDKAINLLLAMDWDTNPSTCLSLLKKLSNYIFVSSLSNPSEKYAQLQMALGSFYFPVRPINHSTEVEFYKPVRNISRRLFHYLLRYDMSDLAFNIAVYLNEHDLFMDLYYYAKSVDSVSLAASAWQKAEQILVEESAANVSCSNSEDCCSCSGSSSESDNCSFLEINDDQSNHRIPVPGSNAIVKPPVIRTSFASVSRLTNSNPLNVQTSTTDHNPLMAPNTSRNSHQSMENVQSSKQKVKFSDVITKITLPEDQDDRNTNSNSNGVTQTQNILKNFYISPNSNLHRNIPSEIAQELLKQSNSPDNKISESKTIKVVHLGVV